MNTENLLYAFLDRGVQSEQRGFSLSAFLERGEQSEQMIFSKNLSERGEQTEQRGFVTKLRTDCFS